VNQLTRKKTKSFGRQKFTWLHKPFVDIWYGFRGKLRSRVGHVKKKLPKVIFDLNVFHQFKILVMQISPQSSESLNHPKI
jgi:hypothetical protein